MKKIIVLLSLVSCFSVFAAEIKTASYDLLTDEVVMEVTYAGGCMEHKFDLKMNELCLETFPMQQGATLVEDTQGDLCEALVHETVRISLKGKMVCRPSYLSISGDQNSSATVFVNELLPGPTPEPIPTPVPVPLPTLEMTVGSFAMVQSQYINEMPGCGVGVSMVMDKAELMGNIVHLTDMLEGFCELYVAPNPRMFKMTEVKEGSCGSVVYTGEHYDNEGLHKLEVIHYKNPTTCRMRIMSEIVMKETINGKLVHKLYKANR